MLECGVFCQSADYLSVCVLGHYVLLAALSLPFSLWAAKLSLCFFFFFFFSLYSSCDWLLGSLSPEIALILSDKTEPASNPLLQSLPTHLSLSLSLWRSLPRGRGVFNPSGLHHKLGDREGKWLQCLLQTTSFMFSLISARWWNEPTHCSWFHK